MSWHHTPLKPRPAIAPPSPLAEPVTHAERSAAERGPKAQPLQPLAPLAPLQPLAPTAGLLPVRRFGAGP